MNRKRVLVMTDSPKLHTGFGRVGKEIWTRLNKTGKYDITAIGWFHQETNEEVTYPIITTTKDQEGKITQQDKYAHDSFPRAVDKYKPELVWTLGDMWMVDHVSGASNRNQFKWVAYFPIDGMPSPSKWGRVVDSMDIAVAYGKWGKEVIRHRALNATLKHIHHGVNTEIFCPRDAQEISYAKRSMLGLPEDKKIIGIVSRNQPRKAFDKLFEAYFYILNGSYFICSDCNGITRVPYYVLTKSYGKVSRCKHCHGMSIAKAKPRDDVRLYIHAAPVDCGWDFIDLQNDFDLGGKVFINPSLRVGVGVPDQTLCLIYNCFDVFTLPTRGEGFGLPILEAMSCGVPIVATNYSAHTEWASEGGILVPYSEMEAEPLTNIRRALIDVDLYIQSLLEILDNQDIARKFSERGRRQAKNMDWDVIVPRWEALVDSLLYPQGAPDVIDPIDLEYNLEEV